MRSLLPRFSLLGCAVALTALAVLAPPAEAASPIPEFPADGVALSGVRDTFDGLRRHIAARETRVGARYVAVIVKFTEPRNRSGRQYSRTAIPYVDRVFKSWADQLDPENHVLICMSTENRGIAIHSGSRWSNLGFAEAGITKVIDESPFARVARTGDHSGALERLVDAVDLHLSLRVQSIERNAARVRDDIGAYGRDIANARAAAKAAGTLTPTVRARLDAAVTGAQSASQRVDAGDVAGAERELRNVHAAISDVRTAVQRAEHEKNEITRLTAQGNALVQSAEGLRAAAGELAETSPRVHTRLTAMDAGVERVRDVLGEGSLSERATAVGNLEARNGQVLNMIKVETANREELLRLRAAAPDQIRIARERLAEVREKVDAAPMRPAGAANVQEVEDLLIDADTMLLASDPRSAVDSAERAGRMLDGIESSVGVAHRSHRFRTTTLPMIIGGALLALLVLLAVLHTLVRRAALRRATLVIERWRKLLGRAGTRLVKMRDDHPFLFGSQRLAQRFTGSTARHFVEMGEGADDLFLTYGAAANQLKRAETVLDEAPVIGWGNFNLIVRLLGESKVELSREQVGDDELFLPETIVVSRPAAELLDHMGDVYEEVYGKVHALEAELVEVPEILAGALDALTAAEESLGDLRTRGVGVAAYEEAHAAHRERHDWLRARVEHDPIGARPDATSLDAAAETLMARLRRVTAARDVLDDALDVRLAAVLKRIAARRVEGLRMSEPGFEPERMSRAAVDAGGAAMTSAAAGEDHAAVNAASHANDTVAEMERLVDLTLTSRDTTPGQLTKLREEEETQRSVLHERGGKIATLQSEHDDRAIMPALDNAEEAATALDFVGGCIDEAHEALTPGAQRYLAAAELARRALHVLADVTDLYAEIDSKAQQLREARQDARETVALARRRSGDLAAFLTADGPFAGESTTDASATLERRVTEETEAQASPKPHWIERLAAAQALVAHEQGVRVVAEEERRARDAARKLSSSLEGDYREAERLLRSSTDDRPPANRRLAEAAALIGHAGEQDGAKHPDWGAMVALLTDAQEHVREAVRMTHEDLELAAAARRSIGKAHDAIANADRSYGHSVRARLGSSRKRLRKARNALAVQQYELARETADAARAKADHARRDAVSAARRKAAAELTKALATAAAVTVFSGRARGGSSWGGSSSSWGSSSGISSGSSSGWSGGFGSSSGGSSFGGSSSGGSSW